MTDSLLLSMGHHCLTFHLVILSHGKFIDSSKYKIYSITKLDVEFEVSDDYLTFYFCSVVCMI